MWDYIVIGAGSAGCAAAYQLAQSGQHKVLLVEAGGSNKSPFIKIPAGVGEASKKYDWGYHSQPDPTRNNQTEAWTRGRVLGGSSSVNGTIFVRGARHDFDNWEKMGNVGWAYKNLLPLFQEMESSDQHGAHRGTSGKLSVRTVKDRHTLTEAFLRSAINNGATLNPDYNGDSQAGVGYAQMTQKKGFRCSAADAFLNPIKKNSNFELRLNTLVHKIEFEDGRATGILCEGKNGIKQEESKNIILCAGAINTPQLLMLSGIGAKEALAQHNIDTVLDKPEVGKNLREHPLIRCVYKTNIPSHNMTEGLLQKLKIAFQYALRRQGPIANIFEAAAFLKTQAKEPIPDVQLHFLAMGLGASGNPDELFLDYPSLTVYVNKNYPQSKGEIRLANSNPKSAPLIECRLLENPTDIDTLVQGVKLVRKIMATQPIAQYIKSESLPNTTFEDDDALKNYARNNAEIGFHPIGTCRMGADDQAVVGADLKLKGVDNLWIADASIMPTTISGNTNAICMLIGMKLGKQLINN